MANQNDFLLLKNAENDAQSMTKNIYNALESHKRAVEFAGGDIDNSEIIADLRDALEHAKLAADNVDRAKSSYDNRYL